MRSNIGKKNSCVSNSSVHPDFHVEGVGTGVSVSICLCLVFPILGKNLGGQGFFFRIKDTYSYSFFMNCTVSFISVFHFKSRGRTDILDAKRRDRDHTPMNRFCFISFSFFINFVQQHKSQSCQGHEIYKSQVSMLKQISTLDHCLSKE